jgi:hypothetical protein
VEYGEVWPAAMMDPVKAVEMPLAVTVPLKATFALN